MPLWANLPATVDCVIRVSGLLRQSGFVIRI